MLQNGMVHLKNLAANVSRFIVSVSDHFGTLCIKGLNDRKTINMLIPKFTFKCLMKIPYQY